ncbi:phage minor tail protein L [Gilliamella sp. Nev5-1]|uniref:phage minor tail protein L n=1 Tax=unclassified Gilliamella TaxID=2685620 RepID=UPI00080DB57B|nr:phage minor tail protein L [Gilliamella apicola]OCG59798.1 phage minor tail protein L [Gilliamella apicola]OCG66826.1 phage minor tail protein L [Gilliamella apicola]
MTLHVPSDSLKLLTKFEQGAMIDLYDVDLSKIAGEKLIFRFHAGLNHLRKAVVWQGKTYEPYPIQVTGFQKNGQGTSNRPTMTVSNAFGLITGLVNSFDDLLGAIVTRRQVLAEFLDAENFEGGNSRADPTQELVSQYLVERLTNLIPSESATFELALPCESDGVILPARVIIAHTCCWRYRSSECSYTGSAVADERDTPTNDITKDKCSGTLTGCKLRFGKNGILPFGGFPASAKLS